MEEFIFGKPIENISDKENIEANMELELFNERINQFNIDDLKQDPDGLWHTFEKKVRDVFPEIPEERFKEFKAAISMYLCDL